MSYRIKRREFITLLGGQFEYGISAKW